MTSLVNVDNLVSWISDVGRMEHSAFAALCSSVYLQYKGAGSAYVIEQALRRQDKSLAIRLDCVEVVPRDNDLLSEFQLPKTFNDKILARTAQAIPFNCLVNAGNPDVNSVMSTNIALVNATFPASGSKHSGRPLFISVIDVLSHTDNVRLPSGYGCTVLIPYVRVGTTSEACYKLMRSDVYNKMVEDGEFNYIGMNLDREVYDSASRLSENLSSLMVSDIVLPASKGVALAHCARANSLDDSVLDDIITSYTVSN